MENHKGKTKRGYSPVNGVNGVNGKGKSSSESSSSPTSPLLALDLTQPPQTSTTSPDRESSKVVEAQSGTERQRAAEEQRGPPSKVRMLCLRCLKKQENCPETDKLVGTGFCTTCYEISRELFRPH